MIGSNNNMGRFFLISLIFIAIYFLKSSFPYYLVADDDGTMRPYCEKDYFEIKKHFCGG